MDKHDYWGAESLKKSHHEYDYLARARMSPEPDPVEAIVGIHLGLSGHVQKIYWTNFNENLATVYCYGLVVHAYM